ncbi:MAG TPA: hypothetical protein DDZ61_22295 [Aeromonas salmonicida]|nr:hypothetical protein [Aeromonas salmonicida]HBL05281.1 hypothetical protein [Aeromonas salmonicida]
MVGTWLADFYGAKVVTNVVTHCYSAMKLGDDMSSGTWWGFIAYQFHQAWLPPLNDSFQIAAFNQGMIAGRAHGGDSDEANVANRIY